MVTLLECIERTPQVLRGLLDSRAENYRGVTEYLLKDGRRIEKVILIGSGSSYNAAMAARGFVERMAGVPVYVEAANPFLYNHSVRKPEALYVFLSQSGTSVTTRRAQTEIKRMGFLTIGITAAPREYLSQETGAHVDMQCFSEEYKMRTIGFCAGVLCIQLLGLTLGRLWGRLTEEEENVWIAGLYAVCENHKRIETAAAGWFEKNKEQVMGSRYYAVYGCDDEWGIALEGALKIMEIGKAFAAGYELEEGMHGPTLAFSKELCVFILNDGGRENGRALGLGRFSKNEFDNGFVIGAQGVEEKDLILPLSRPGLCGYDFICAIQVICWYMAQAKGVDLTVPIAENEKPYFQTHKYD